MKYIVYEHILKLDKRKYIGITKQKPQKRWQKGLGYVNSSYFYNAIQKYGWDNFEHIILFDNLTKEEAEQKEKELIKKYKTNIKGYGFNLNEGGFSPTITEEQKIKISNSEKGKVVSKKTRKKLSERIKEYYKKNGTTPNMQKYYKEATKPVKCIETGIIYYGKKDLTKNGYNAGNISLVCSGKRKTSNKYHWEYV